MRVSGRLRAVEPPRLRSEAKQRNGQNPMRTVLYARFSSALQNARSIEDQVALLRDRIGREGWEEVAVFTDHAISGAAGIEEGQRPGLNALLARVEAGGVDQVLAESTDRIARHQGDAFAIHERILYAGARLFTLSDGEVTDITVAFKGLMDARFRKEMGAKIRRGQRGSVAAGRAPAGLAYGYRSANRIEADGRIVRGLREIEPEQAAIVRRIFTEYTADLSPRMIAERLNAEGVPAPTGGTWRASTIAGDRVRGNGILQNRLYAGVMVVGRTSKVTDPRTRKVRIRTNPESEWVSQPVPDLRIVDDDLWERARKLRQRHAAGRPEYQRRPKHMLSGLAVCGCCGGGYTVASRDFWGCGKHRDGRGCANGRKIGVTALEARVLAGLKEKLLDPELVRIYVAEYHRDFARRAQALARGRAQLEREIAKAETQVANFVKAIAVGGEMNELVDALEQARALRDSRRAELAEIEAAPVIALMPNIADQYRDRVADLARALETPERRAEALPRARALIERITITPDPNRQRGVLIEVEGRLTQLLALATGQTRGEDDELTIAVERVRGIEPL